MEGMPDSINEEVHLKLKFYHNIAVVILSY